MCKCFVNQNETGYATVIAIVVIVVMGILLAGLIPLGTTVTQSAGFTRGNLQAQYIAEAGAKRAIAELSNGGTNWGWLGSDNFENKQNVTGTTAQYGVRITPTLSGAPTAGTYTITSTGYYGKFSKKVTVQAVVTVGTQTMNAVNSTFAIGGDITTNPKTSSFTFSSNGSVEYTRNLDASVMLGGNLATNNNHEFINQNKKLDITEINIPYALSLAKDHFTKPIGGSNQYVPLTAGKYYRYDDDLVLNSNSCGIQGPEASNEFAVVVVDGSLTINATSGFHIKGNVVFLVKNNFIFDSNQTDLADGIIYCNGDAIIKKAQQNVTLQMIIDGSLILENDFTNCNPNYNKELFNFLNATIGSGGAGGAASVTVSNWAKGT